MGPKSIPQFFARLPVQFATPATEKQYHADMDQVSQYVCAKFGGLDEASRQLLGVHDSNTRHSYEDIQEFLVRKQGVEQRRRQHHQQHQKRIAPMMTESVLICGLDEYLNELDPTLFVELAPVTPIAS
ncbi:uncharacterized protein CCR75_009349 [Bremia lactucae]|uniref:Uncharacterized protein n=1 Tax=Bremia lactucae TaxID=4779 RepID=A0A976IK33_BRELC|nr:hypothetical protein CCR75_009349 [Bremia lactucae]